MTMKGIKEATKSDLNLQAVIQTVQTGNWHKTKTLPAVSQRIVQSFKKTQKELTVNQDASLVRRGTSIVIPAILQPRKIDVPMKDSNRGL